MSESKERLTYPAGAGDQAENRAVVPRRHKLHIIHPAASGRLHSFRCTSSPNRNRYAGLRFGFVAVSSAMNGRLKILEKNLSSLSFRYAVELDMLMGIIADTVQLDRDDLKRRRTQSVKNVRQTNGRVSLEKRAQLWDETTDWDDDEWQN